MSSNVDLFLEKFFSPEDLNTIAYNNRHGESEPLSEEDKFILEEIFGKGGTPIKITGDDIYPTDKKYEGRTLDLVEQTNESYYKSLMSYELIELDFTKKNNNKQMEKLLSFGEAINLLKEGEKVSRVGWNGKGMYLELQVPNAFCEMSLPYISMFTAQGDLVPWLASQTDILSEDWCVVE